MSTEKILDVNLRKRQMLGQILLYLFQTQVFQQTLGFAEQSEKKFELGLIRNHYVGRTFIEPTQNIRSLGVKLKLSSTKTIVKDKVIILIDDSLVRGTTCHKIVKMLYESDAKKFM